MVSLAALCLFPELVVYVDCSTESWKLANIFIFNFQVFQAPANLPAPPPLIPARDLRTDWQHSGAYLNFHKPLLRLDLIAHYITHSSSGLSVGVWGTR